MDKQARIDKLKLGIDSESTPEHLKKLMQTELDELLKPEQTPEPKKKRGNPNFIKGEKNTYYIKKVKVPEPTPKKRVFTDEEKAKTREYYAKLRERKKAKNNN